MVVQYVHAPVLHGVYTSHHDSIFDGFNYRSVEKQARGTNIEFADKGTAVMLAGQLTCTRPYAAKHRAKQAASLS